VAANCECSYEIYVHLPATSAPAADEVQAPKTGGRMANLQLHQAEGKQFVEVRYKWKLQYVTSKLDTRQKSAGLVSEYGWSTYTSQERWACSNSPKMAWQANCDVSVCGYPL